MAQGVKDKREPATLVLEASGEGGPKQSLQQIDGSMNDILFMQPLCQL